MGPNLEVRVETIDVGGYRVRYLYIEAPLDVQEAAFADSDLKMVSPALLGYLRARSPLGVITFDRSSRTNTEVIHDDRDGGRVVVVPDSAISKVVGVAPLVDAHRQNREYVIPIEQRSEVYAIVDEMLRSDTAFVAPYGQQDISTKNFRQNPVASQLYGDQTLGFDAGVYGDWLQSQNRYYHSTHLADETCARKQPGPYVDRLAVLGIEDTLSRRDFVCRKVQDLHTARGAFGVHFERLSGTKH